MSNDFTSIISGMTPSQLAQCLAASAIHQIGGTLELKSMMPGSVLLVNLTNEMRQCARDIIGTVESDPWMFYVQIGMAISSCVLELVDMEYSNDE